MGKNWFFETLSPDATIGLRVKNTLYKKKSKLQNIKVLDTYSFGRTLVLDGIIQTTEKDEFIYHEMLTHPVMLTSSRPENILVIGAGDGGILREVLKYPVKKITLVEIDKTVINLSKKYLPSIHKNSFASKKLNLVIENGAEFVKNTKEVFDVAIIDSPDPVGPAKILFSKKFYKNIYEILSPEGIMARQSGSTFLQENELKENYKILKDIFPYVYIYTAGIPTYIGGLFSFIMASKTKKTADLTAAGERIIKSLKTKYYNRDIHRSCFMLPEYIKKLTGWKEQ